MSVIVFVALVAGNQSDGYTASFPDVAACVANGRTLPELLVNARQALTAALEALENEGEAWPTATPLEDVTISAGEMPIPIDVSVDDPPLRLNISLGERLVQRLDAAAETRGMTRSGFIAQAVRVSLGETGKGGAEFDVLGQRLQDELNILGRKINDSIGPESPFTRRMNDLDEVLYDGVRRAADSVSAAMTRRRSGTTRQAQPSSSAVRPDGGSGE